MIGFTKLLCGTAMVADVLRGDGSEKLLQFSATSPIVVWNVTHRCNLRCKHCYIEAGDRKKNAMESEITTEEGKELISDLAGMNVPVLLFSGGEALIREDIFELGKYAGSKGIRTVLSSNGTLITKDIASKIKETGFSYVGISIDGLPATHNRFRNAANAFEMAKEGIDNLKEVGVKVGVRFTINRYNYHELKDILRFVVDSGVPRFCMYHLVYSGRGKEMTGDDITNKERMDVFNTLKEFTLELHQKGIELEVLTTDNHADGILIHRYIKENMPQRADEVMELLRMHGGCSAGTKVANIGPTGNVHPCQFWTNRVLGNVREKAFSRIWNDTKNTENTENEFLSSLRNKGAYLKGKCGKCTDKDVCGGCRVRAEAVHGDMWQEDPCCYIESEE
ncbi:MAG: radical SAM protein [bacterium]|nr:radical SAM protein [bacterium]